MNATATARPWLDQQEGPYFDEGGNELEPSPFFPGLHPRYIELIFVYRMVQREDETQPRPIYLPIAWDNPLTVDVGDLANTFGGSGPHGFRVQAKWHGKITGVARVDVDGPPRAIASVQGYDAATAPAGSPAHESKSGIMSIPGLDPMMQLLYVQQQQRTWELRDDNHKTLQVIAQMMGKAGSGNDGEVLREMRGLINDLRTHNDTLNAELRAIRKDNLGLSVANATAAGPQGLVGIVSLLLEKSQGLLPMLKEIAAALPTGPQNGAAQLPHGAVVVTPAG